MRGSITVAVCVSTLFVASPIRGQDPRADMAAVFRAVVRGFADHFRIPIERVVVDSTTSGREPSAAPFAERPRVVSIEQLRELAAADGFHLAAYHEQWACFTLPHLIPPEVPAGTTCRVPDPAAWLRIAGPTILGDSATASMAYHRLVLEPRDPRTGHWSFGEGGVVEFNFRRTAQGWILQPVGRMSIGSHVLQDVHVQVEGSPSCRAEPCFGTATGEVAVRQLLVDLAGEPRDSSWVSRRLVPTGLDANDLVRLGIIRRDGSVYRPAMPVFLYTELLRVREVVSRYAGSLADSLLAHTSELEAALAWYRATGVDSKAVAFVLLGFVSLERDGLEVSLDRGYGSLTRRPDGRFGAWAQQRHDEFERRMYGSSGGMVSSGDVQLVAVGDGNAGWLPRLQSPPAPLRASAVTQQAGRFLLSLREGGRLTLDEVRSRLGLPVGEAEALAQLLVELQFISRQGDVLLPAIPVFARSDRATVERVRRIGRGVIERWLATNYDSLRSDLSFTAAARSGVAYQETFTAIWHFLFGLANQRLVLAGLFADPYAPSRFFKGGLPAVFEKGVL